VIDTAFEHWAAQNAGFDAEWAAAGDDPIKMLCVALRRSGARLTFDLGASFERPCTVCGTTSEPRALIRIGTYLDGTAIERPVCERHRLVMHLHGAEPGNRQLQALAAYEAARGGDRRRAPAQEELAVAIVERASGRPRGLTVGWSAAPAARGGARGV
jgi:hypothetical protein